MTPLEHALHYAARGWRVAPVPRGHKYPHGMPDWPTRATTNTAQLEQWWPAGTDHHGVSIVTGVQSGIFVVDVDPRHGGDETLADLEHEHGELPDTVEALTGGGGRHLLFNMPADVVITNDAGKRLGPGLDVRGEGGQIVAPPTIHPDTGRPYTWEALHDPHDGVAVADPPAWLIDLLTAELAAPTPRRVERAVHAASERPGDRFEAETQWADLLQADGWTLHSARNGRDGSYELWTRPGKDPRDGASASLYWQGSDVLKVFTSSVPGLAQEATYTRFGYWAAMHHGGDHGASARELGRRYGTSNTGTGNSPADVRFEDPPAPSFDDELRGMLIDWPEFWAQDHADAEWIAEPVLPAKRSVALFAPGGTGKSLLALWLSAHLANGTDPFTGRPTPPIHVLYLDYEMTEADLSERLEQMGFGADADLTHLHYALLPSLPGLDEAEGGKAVVRLAQLIDAQLVVIDTFGRAVHGDENDADTVRAWYRWTGLHLKHDGRAFLRVDHAGKDLAKGQRGTSAKNDDVDVVWQMTAKEAQQFTLTAKKRRMGWVPMKIEIAMLEEPILGFELVAGESWPLGTKETAEALDELGVALDDSARAAAKVLRAGGRAARNEVVRAAQKYRKARSSTFHFVGDKAVDNLHESFARGGKSAPQNSGRAPTDNQPGAPRGATSTNTESDQLDDSGRDAGRGGARVASQVGRDAPPLKGARAPSEPEPTINFEEVF